MPNITLSISTDLYRLARICAARHDLSLSALVRRFLESLVKSPSPFGDHEGPDAEPAEAEDPTPPFLSETVRL